MGSGPFNPAGLKCSFHDRKSFIKNESPLFCGAGFLKPEAAFAKRTLVE
jgi:hypothetical protein